MTWNVQDVREIHRDAPRARANSLSGKTSGSQTRAQSKRRRTQESRKIKVQEGAELVKRATLKVRSRSGGEIAEGQVELLVVR